LRDAAVRVIKIRSRARVVIYERGSFDVRANVFSARARNAH
jgi:hypothetical protein